MKRTIQEIYELIKQKKESAERDLKRTKKLIDEEEWDYMEDEGKHSNNVVKYANIRGEIEAYTDVLCLIESRGVLDDR